MSATATATYTFTTPGLKPRAPKEALENLIWAGPNGDQSCIMNYPDMKGLPYQRGSLGLQNLIWAGPNGDESCVRPPSKKLSELIKDRRRLPVKPEVQALLERQYAIRINPDGSISGGKPVTQADLMDLAERRYAIVQRPDGTFIGGKPVTADLMDLAERRYGIVQLPDGTIVGGKPAGSLQNLLERGYAFRVLKDGTITGGKPVSQQKLEKEQGLMNLIEAAGERTPVGVNQEDIDNMHHSDIMDAFHDFLPKVPSDEQYREEDPEVEAEEQTPQDELESHPIDVIDDYYEDDYEYRPDTYIDSPEKANGWTIWDHALYAIPAATLAAIAAYKMSQRS